MIGEFGECLSIEYQKNCAFRKPSVFIGLLIKLTVIRLVSTGVMVYNLNPYIVPLGKTTNTWASSSAG